jgi:thioredoxin-like negative regulator of GroEL
VESDVIGAVDVDVVSMLSEATQLQADGQYQEAEGLIREALQISPGYPDALARLADIAVKGQRSADALEIIDRALLQLPHRADFHFLHADHVIAESKGGPTTLENLVTACMDCNLGKSDKDLLL